MAIGINEILKFLWPFLTWLGRFVANWWWVFLTLFLWKKALSFWLWWRQERWLNNVYFPILLEIKLPPDIKKPIEAMENVMAAIHGVIYQPPDWWEHWIDGQLQTGVSFEIVSIGGEIHFYLRFHKAYRNGVEAAIYSQFPEAEIYEVEDYAKNVPPSIPNKEWDLWGTDYRLFRPDPYPIKTYHDFETKREKPEEIVDPLSHLLEGLAKVQEGEQFWLQIRATPIGGAACPGYPEGTAAEFLKEGEKIKTKLLKRPQPKKPKPLLQEAIEIWLPGWEPPGPEKTEKEVIPPEMRLSPGEREIVEAIERKLSKPAFSCGLRFIFLGKKDVYHKPTLRMAFNFFSCFATNNLNALYPWGETITKIKKSWFLPLNLIRKRRLYVRCRKMFKKYKDRVAPLYPRSKKDREVFILNTEELASLFHFPAWETAPVPGWKRIEAKKGPPPSLPTE